MSDAKRLTAGEWLQNRARERFEALMHHIRPKTVPLAIVFLTQEIARLQARADLLEQAVGGLTNRGHGQSDPASTPLVH